MNGYVIQYSVGGVDPTVFTDFDKAMAKGLETCLMQKESNVEYLSKKKYGQNMWRVYNGATCEFVLLEVFIDV